MFDIEVAKQVGVVAAILFQNIAFWCQHSMANNANWNDGRYWTFNTNKAFCEMFPYLSSKMIRTALQKLIAADLIMTGNFNKLTYDRTMWYALTDMGNSIFLNGKKDLPIGANGFDHSGEPIPDINTNINTDVNIDNNILDGFDEFWKAYPRRDGKQDAMKAWKSLNPGKELQRAIIDDIKKRLAPGGAWYRTERRFIKMAGPYLRGERWEDEGGEEEIAECARPDPVIVTDEELAEIDRVLALNGRDAYM